MNHSFLPSDDQNPDFQGAHNPDQRLTAQFFVHPVQNNFESEKQGRPIFDDIEMIRIHVPGDTLNVVVAPVRPDHKKRFPLQWAHFSNQMAGDQRLAGKTPISQWPRLTPSQAEELKYLKFLSVEDVANASDGALQSIGMVGGMSPYAFRDAAQRFLSLATADAETSKVTQALAKSEADNAEMKKQMAIMQAQIAAIANSNSASTLEILAEENAVEVPATPAKQKRAA